MAEFTQDERDQLSKRGAAAELLRRQRCRESLIGFAQNIVIPGAPLGEDLEDLDGDGHSGGWKDDVDGSSIDEHLLEPVGSGITSLHILLMTKLQQAMMKAYGRLMVFMPPGSAKSTYGTVIAPDWYMGKFPGSQIILGSYNSALAKKHGSRARNIVQQAIYENAFHTRISPDTTAKEMWALTNGSEYMSAGLLSGITGNRADGLLIDDPVKGRADAKSEAVQRKTKEAYEDDAKTRLKPRGWIILIQTRWDMNDLAGGILPRNYEGESGRILCRDGMEWEVINLPAKAEREDDPLHRLPGEYLWPEWFDSMHWYQYEPRVGDLNSPSQASWDSLFQQKPRPTTGNQWEDEWTQWYKLDKHPEYLMLYCFSDYAVTEKSEGDDPDFSEHGIIGLDENADLWVIDWWYGQTTTDHSIAALINLCRKWNVKNGFGEMGIIRRAIEAQWKMQQRQKKYWVGIEYLPHIGDKVAKFADTRALGSSGKVHIPDCPWGRRLHSQMLVFPSPGEKDDGVDVMGLAGRATKDMTWSRVKVIQHRPKGVVFGSWEWLQIGTEKDQDFGGNWLG